MGQHAGFQRLAQQRILGPDLMGTAQLGNRLGLDPVVAHSHQAGRTDLAELCQLIEQALRIARSAAERTKPAECIAHRHRAADQLLLQLVM